jgi:hypothetical protein
MRNPNLLKVLIVLLSICDYETGQWSGGRFQLAELVREKDSLTYYLVRRLQTLGILTLKSNNKFTTISIVKWKEYQSESNTSVSQQTNNKLTTNSQQTNTLIRSKEIRSKEVKNKTIDNTQLSELQKQFPTKQVKEEYEKCKDYISSSGKTYKDYVAMFRNWLRRAPDTRIPQREYVPIEVDQEKLDILNKGARDVLGIR